MNDQTRIVIGTLQVNRILRSRAAESALRDYHDWLGVVLILRPEARISFFNNDRLLKVAEAVGEAIGENPFSNEPNSLEYAVYEDSMSKVDWVEVAKYVLPYALELANEEVCCE